tara:strand:- start:682 stop:837 length:156 start_codon:yes stop_codon:yes gene_type:complete
MVLSYDEETDLAQLRWKLRTEFETLAHKNQMEVLNLMIKSGINSTKTRGDV